MLPKQLQLLLLYTETFTASQIQILNVYMCFTAFEELLKKTCSLVFYNVENIFTVTVVL